MPDPTYDKLLGMMKSSLLTPQAWMGDTQVNLLEMIQRMVDDGLDDIAAHSITQQALNAIWPEIQEMLRAEFNRGFAGGEQSWAESYAKSPPK